MDIPRPIYARRAFYLITALICTLLALLEFLVIPVIFSARTPSLPSVFSQLVSALLTSIVSAVLIGTIVFWLIPTRDEEVRDVEVISAHERKEVHEQARADTQIWWYTGAIGRYNRAVTFPDLARRARLTNSSKNVVLLLIDPDNVDACRRYASWRNGLRSTKGSEQWDPERVRLELLATILCAHSWATQEPFLEMTIALKREWSIVRVDMSTRVAIVTAEDSQYPALKCRSGGFYYNILREDLRLMLSQARTLPVGVTGKALKDLTSETAHGILTKLGLHTEDLCVAALESVIRLAKNPENPYG